MASDDSVTRPVTQSLAPLRGADDFGGRLAGIEAPVWRFANPTPEMRAAWVSTVERMLARGLAPVECMRAVRALSEAKRRAMPSDDVIQRMCVEVTAGWRAGVTPDLRNVRREQLYASAGDVARRAITELERLITVTSAEGRVDAKGAALLLKVALEAQARQADLVGADLKGPAATVTVDASTTVNAAQAVVATLGLDAAALARAGDALADEISSAARRKGAE